MRFAFLTFLLFSACGAAAQNCRVADPELRGAYAGPCVNGLAEGLGHAGGVAQYHGEFKAGLKHGHGVKTWPNGDRYDGDFVDDRKEGHGTYTWGRGRWEGERYEGAYRNDLRDGFGIYRWPTGDVYAGPWERDRITGPATPMMVAQAKHREEARAAVAKQGQRVCREAAVGLAEKLWVRGTVVAVSPDTVQVRIDDPGASPVLTPGGQTRRGDLTWDAPEKWTPCL